MPNQPHNTNQSDIAKEVDKILSEKRGYSQPQKPTILTSTNELPRKEQTINIEEIEEYTKTLEQELQKIEFFKEETLRIKRENALLLQKISLKDTQIKELTEHIKVVIQLEKALPALQNELKNAQIKIDELQKDENLSNKEREDLKDNLKLAEKQSSLIQENLKDSENEFKKLNLHIKKDLKPQIEKQKETISKQTSKIEITTKLEETIGNMNNRVDAVKNENEKLRDIMLSDSSLASDERMKNKTTQEDYKLLYAELVAITEEHLRKGTLLPIHNPTIRDNSYAWALEHILKEASNKNINKNELYHVLNIFPDREYLLALLQKTGKTEIKNKRENITTINKILLAVEKHDKDFVKDSIGLYNYLMDH